MGRALLIITLGSFIILGIIQQAVNNRQIAMTDGNVETFFVNHTRNATGSGLEFGINRIVTNSDWETIPQPWLFPVDELDGDVEVWVDTHDDFPTEIGLGFLRVNSQIQLGNRPVRSFAFLRVVPFEIPDAVGALAVYGRNSRVDIRGNPLKVVGYDTNPDGTRVPDSAVPGIASRTPEDELVSATGPPGSEPVQYEGEDKFHHDPDMEDDELMRMLEDYMNLGTPYESDDLLGTPENPRITIIDQPGTRFAGGTTGAGILIVAPDADLFVGGDFRFEGLVIIQGDFLAVGTVDIFGGAIMTDNAGVGLEDPEAMIDDPDISMRGTPTIYYSSHVLENLRNRLGGGNTGGVTVSRIFY
jgi:hypothetical protein